MQKYPSVQWDGFLQGRRKNACVFCQASPNTSAHWTLELSEASVSQQVLIYLGRILFLVAETKGNFDTIPVF